MIRSAKTGEHQRLTEISFSAKKYWNYPPEYYVIWEQELTITAGYILSNDVYVLEKSGEVIAYYSLVDLAESQHVSEIEIEAGLWLEHMFVLPDYIGKTIGTRLFAHCAKVGSKKNHAKLNILSDPNSTGFYQKMGCRFVCDYPSTIAGRTTPLLQYTFNRAVP